MTGVKLSIRAAAFGETLRDALPRAQRAGFCGISLDIFSSLLDAASLSQTGQREVRHLLARHDQALASLRAAIPGASLASDLDRVLWQAQRCMTAAANLGAACVCLDVGHLPPPRRESGIAPRPTITPRQAGLILLPGSMDMPVPEESPADPRELAQWPAIQQAVTEIARIADHMGQRVALSSELSSMESLGQLLAAANCPLMGLELDPVAVLSDRWDMSKTLSRLGTLVLEVRGRDALKGASGRTQSTPIGRGSVNWEELLHLLDEGAFKGWLTVDPLTLPDRADQARRAATYFAALLRPRD